MWSNEKFGSPSKKPPRVPLNERLMPTHFTDQKKGHPTKELIELSDPFFGEIPSSNEN